MMRRNGFTLVELVVIILILGILAGVAAPKMFNTSANATDNGLKQTLGIVRDAIELYSAQNTGALPPCAAGDGGASFRLALKDFIRGPFPKCPVGANNFNVIPTTGLTTAGVATPDDGWVFNTDNGTFIANFSGFSKSLPLVKYEEF